MHPLRLYPPIMAPTVRRRRRNQHVHRDDAQTLQGLSKIHHKRANAVSVDAG
jgi:hypothetical protein